jgi:hypothetical protein
MSSHAAKVLLLSSTGEATWGSTAVAASRKLHGVEDFEMSIVTKGEAVPAVGWYGPGPVADEVSQSAEFNFKGTVTYQELPKILNGLFTYTSGSTSAAAPYVFPYSAPIASTQICATYPMEGGVSTGNAYKVVGGIFGGLKLSGEAGGLWKFEVPGVGKHISYMTSGMSTAANAESRYMVPVNMKDTSIRITPFATGVCPSSSGQVDAVLVSFDFNLDCKRHTKLFAGSRLPGGWGDNRYEGTLNTVLEFTSGFTLPLINEMLGSTMVSTGVALQRLISLHAAAASTAGSSGFAVDLHFGGIVTEPIKLWDDRDGNMTANITWTGKFSTALAALGTSGTGNWLAFLCTNDSSSTT